MYVVWVLSDRNEEVENAVHIKLSNRYLLLCIVNVKKTKKFVSKIMRGIKMHNEFVLLVWVY